MGQQYKTSFYYLVLYAPIYYFPFVWLTQRFMIQVKLLGKNTEMQFSLRHRGNNCRGRFLNGMWFSFQHFASSQVSRLGDPQDYYPLSAINALPQDCWWRAQPQAVLSHLGSAKQAAPYLASTVSWLFFYSIPVIWNVIYLPSVSEDITALVLGVMPFPVTGWLLLFHSVSPSKPVFTNIRWLQRDSQRTIQGTKIMSLKAQLLAWQNL